jgi:hypothetical protein
VSVSEADAVPTGELAYVVPSPIEVIVALYESFGVRPVKSAVPDVLPVCVDVAFVDVLSSTTVLDVACGFGVKVTVMDVVDV